jgi:flagellar protein FlaG
MVNEVSQNVVLAMPVPREASKGNVAANATVEAAAIESLRADAATRTRVEGKPLAADRQEVDSNAVEVADTLNDFAQRIQRKLQFSIDKQSGDTVITVLDLETEELVRQIPSEEILNIRHHLEQLQEDLYEGELPGLLFAATA